MTLPLSKAHYVFDPASLPVLADNNITSQDCMGTELLYSVSSTVTLADGTPFADVTISDGQAHSATTEAFGTCEIVNLVAANYTLSASLIGYQFTPATYPIMVPVAGLSAISRLSLTRHSTTC